MRWLFGFLIPDLRLEIVLDSRGQWSGALLRNPVELSKLRTTDGNIVVTSCQVLMIGGNLAVLGSRLASSVEVEKARG
jgi:hypothetical protein